MADQAEATSAASASTTVTATPPSPARNAHVRSVSAVVLNQRTGNLPFLRTETQVKDMLKDFFVQLTERTTHHLGYPYNLHFDSGDLKPFLEYAHSPVPWVFSVVNRVFNGL
jgi:hypothetical protein